MLFNSFNFLFNSLKLLLSFFNFLFSNTLLLFSNTLILSSNTLILPSSITLISSSNTLFSLKICKNNSLKFLLSSSNSLIQTVLIISLINNKDSFLLFSFFNSSFCFLRLLISFSNSLFSIKCLFSFFNSLFSFFNSLFSFFNSLFSLKICKNNCSLLYFFNISKQSTKSIIDSIFYVILLFNNI